MRVPEEKENNKYKNYNGIRALFSNNHNNHFIKNYELRGLHLLASALFFFKQP